MDKKKTKLSKGIGILEKAIKDPYCKGNCSRCINYDLKQSGKVCSESACGG